MIINNPLAKDHIFNHLSPLGWGAHFQEQLGSIKCESLIPARITGVRKNSFLISDGKEERLSTLAGKIQHDPNGMYPVTGDWVLAADSVIARVLVRKNALSRGASGMHTRKSGVQREQVIAANLDTVFIVCGLDRDYNLRRIERYLTLIYNCGLVPVIILTKADLHPSPEQCAAEVESNAFGVPVHLISLSDDACLAELERYLTQGHTCAMVGSSGAGKSTLINRLHGKTIQATSAVSTQVGKGRHTTTSRDLIMMPDGGMIIDNPGIREISFWDDDNGVEAAFPEIEALAQTCRFSDCSHTHEPGCRVLDAVTSGELSLNRLENYRKMKRELEYISSRKSKSADRVEKERWKGVALKIKAINKKKSL